MPEYEDFESQYLPDNDGLPLGDDGGEYFLDLPDDEPDTELPFDWGVPRSKDIYPSQSSLFRCKVEMEDGPCGRLLHTPATKADRRPVCLMHSLDPAKADGALGQLFSEEIYSLTKAAKKSGSVDFTRFVFFWDEDEWEVSAHCNFEKANIKYASWRFAKFRGGASFKGARFGDVCLDYSQFAGDVDFTDAIFTRNAEFDLAEFSNRVDFIGTKFKGSANFMKTNFNDEVFFINCIFSEGAVFDRTWFEDSVSFEGSKFLGDVFFWETTFKSFAGFVTTKFEGMARFNYARFWNVGLFRETSFLQTNPLRPSSVFASTFFIKPQDILFFKTNLGQVLFGDCDLTEVNFSNVSWGSRKRNRKRMIFDEVVDTAIDWISDRHALPSKNPDRDYSFIAEKYHQLRTNYEAKNDTWAADDFHYGEMEMRRLTSDPQEASLHRFWRKNLGMLAWYRRVSDYGENYRRPIYFLCMALLIFAFVYPVKGLRHESRSGSGAFDVLSYRSARASSNDQRAKWKAEGQLVVDSVLTSVEVAAFQKQLFYEPAYRTGRFLVLCEIVTTSILSALFLLAVRRKFRR